MNIDYAVTWCETLPTGKRVKRREEFRNADYLLVFDAQAFARMRAAHLRREGYAACVEPIR